MRALAKLFGSIVFVAAPAFLFASCDAGGVGDPCVPEEEFQHDFSGFSRSEVNFESGSLQCKTRTCLVNHFQGRVSCPFGQDEAALDLAPNDPRRCRLPGLAGADESEAVVVPVDPWKVDRTPEQAVYCSCRCAGPDKSARYCECPSGYTCAELTKEYVQNRRQLTGSYCVKDGTVFDPTTARSATCVERPDDPHCPADGVNP